MNLWLNANFVMWINAFIFLEQDSLNRLSDYFNYDGDDTYLHIYKYLRQMTKYLMNFVQNKLMAVQTIRFGQPAWI